MMSQASEYQVRSSTYNFMTFLFQKGFQTPIQLSKKDEDGNLFDADYSKAAYAYWFGFFVYLKISAAPNEKLITTKAKEFQVSYNIKSDHKEPTNNANLYRFLIRRKPSANSRPYFLLLLLLLTNQ